MKKKLSYYLAALLLVVLVAFLVKPDREAFDKIPFPSYWYTAAASDVFREPDTETTQAAIHFDDAEDPAPAPELPSP